MSTVRNSTGMVGEPQRPEPEPLFVPWPSKRWRGIILGVVVLAGLGIPGLYYFRFFDAATRDSQERQAQQQQARADCAREISSSQQAARDEMVLAKARLDQASTDAQIELASDRSRLPELVANVAMLSAELKERIAAVEGLPDYAKAVDRRCPSV